MGLLDDLSKREPKSEPKAEPVAGHYGVRLELKEEKVSLTAGQTREYDVLVTNNGTEDDTIRIKVDLVYNSELPDPPEWTAKLFGVEEKVWDVTYTKITEKEFLLIADGQREITLTVTCPKGARYGDRLNVVVNAISKGDPGVFDAKTLSFSARQAILAVKSSIGHERAVADAIYARAKAKDLGVFSILVPANFRGYVYVESMNPDRLEEIVRGLRRARGVVKGEGESTGIGFSEIEAYLTPKPIVSGIMEGDIVELVAGPFKGEKARVMKIRGDGPHPCDRPGRQRPGPTEGTREVAWEGRPSGSERTSPAYASGSRTAPAVAWAPGLRPIGARLDASARLS